METWLAGPARISTSPASGILCHCPDPGVWAPELGKLGVGMCSAWLARGDSTCQHCSCCGNQHNGIHRAGPEQPRAGIRYFGTFAASALQSARFRGGAFTMQLACRAYFPHEQAVEKMHELGCQGLSNAVWSYTKPKHPHHCLSSTFCTRAVTLIEEFLPQELSNAVRTLTSLLLQDGASSDSAAARVARSKLSLSHQDTANVV